MTDDLATYYDLTNGEAEPVTLAGTPGVAAIFEVATEVALGDALVQAPTLRLPASVATALAVAEGSTCTVRGQPYVVRQVLDLPPDGAERLLILARA